MIQRPDSPDHRPDLQELGRRVVRGGLSLGARQILASLVGVAAGVTLARTLEPTMFGVYAVVAFVTKFFSHFSNVGLGAALIRRPHIDDDDLSTAFAMQQGLVLVTVLALWVTAGLWAVVYDLAGIAPMIRTLALGLWLSSLGTISSLRLEREMRFETLALTDLASTFTYHALAVVLALGGHGVWSFLFAALGRSAVQAFALNLACPWRPRLRFRADRARDLLSFGLPFQLNKIVTLFKDNITPTLVALASGATAVGYLNWAQTVAYFPLAVMPILQRVTFPAYARIQNDSATLRRALELSFRVLALGIYPIVFLLIALAPEIVRVVYTDKWLPALPAVYCFSVATLWAAVSTPITSALYAVGRATVVLRLTVIWTLAGWGLSLPLIYLLGFNGFAVAMLLVSQLSILAVREGRRVVPLRIVRQIILPLGCAATMGLVVRLAGAPLVSGVLSLAGVTGLGVLLYVTLIALLGGRTLRAELGPVFGALLPPSFAAFLRTAPHPALPGEPRRGS